MVSRGAQLLALSCLSLPSLIEPFLVAAPGAGALIGKSRLTRVPVVAPCAALIFDDAPATLLSEVGREGRDRQGRLLFVFSFIVHGLGFELRHLM